MIGHAEHALETVLGDLHDIAGLFVDGHRLAAGDAVGAEDEPLPVGSPLMVRLINLGIARALGGRQESQRHARDWVRDGFLFGGKPFADLGGRRERQQEENSEDFGHVHGQEWVQRGSGVN